MCKSKIHRGRVKKLNLHYKGSIGIDTALLQKSDILPYEIVQVVNVRTGVRFETYALKEKRGSGIIALYGGAARLGKIGDIIIVLSYILVNSKRARGFRPKIVLVDKNNAVVRKRR